MSVRPTGTVTFLFTDVVGSTAAWEADPQRMADALAVHDDVLRASFDQHGGYVFATGGDGFAVAFQRADDAGDTTFVPRPHELVTGVCPDAKPQAS